MHLYVLFARGFLFRKLIKTRRYREPGEGRLTGLISMVIAASVIPRVFSLHSEGATHCAMKASNVFGAVRRERNGAALTVDSW